MPAFSLNVSKRFFFNNLPVLGEEELSPAVICGADATRKKQC